MNKVDVDLIEQEISLGKSYAVLLISEHDGWYEAFCPNFDIISNLHRHPIDAWHEVRGKVESGIINKAFDERLKKEESNGSSEGNKETGAGEEGNGGVTTIDPTEGS